MQNNELILELFTIFNLEYLPFRTLFEIYEIFRTINKQFQVQDEKCKTMN